MPNVKIDSNHPNYNKLFGLRKAHLEKAKLAAQAIRQALIEELINLYKKMQLKQSTSDDDLSTSSDDNSGECFAQQCDEWVQKVDIYNKFLADLQQFANGEIQRIPRNDLWEFASSKSIATYDTVSAFINDHCYLVREEDNVWTNLEENYYKITGSVLNGLGWAIMIGILPAIYTFLLLVNPGSLPLLLSLGLITVGIVLGPCIVLLGDMLKKPSPMVLINADGNPVVLDSVSDTAPESDQSVSSAGACADSRDGSPQVITNKKIELKYYERNHQFFSYTPLNIEATYRENIEAAYRENIDATCQTNETGLNI